VLTGQRARNRRDRGEEVKSDKKEKVGRGKGEGRI
jgi:hypothetical protein